MLININHYMRLRHIAFFIPNITGNKETEYSIPLNKFLVTVEKNDIKLKKELFEKIISVLLTSNDNFFCSATECMQIKAFEVKFFLVCIAIYNNLSGLFSPYAEQYKPRKGVKDISKYSFEDDSEGFYRLIPSGAISKDMVKEKSYGMFRSTRKACYFYCKFTPSYLLYLFSIYIKTHKSDIPVLTYLRDSMANHFCSFPAESFSLLNENVSNLQETIDLYFECKDAVEKLHGEDRTSWNYLLERMLEGITIKCFGISKAFSTEPIIPGLRHHFNEIYAYGPDISKKKKQKNNHPKDDFDTIPKEEKKRRKRISKSQNKRLSQRQEKVQKHIESIISSDCAKKCSVKVACERYFGTKKDDLKKINITSARTLQNLCSHTKPDKQRTNFVNRSYLSPTYSKDFQDTIELIYNKIDFSA